MATTLLPEPESPVIKTSRGCSGEGSGGPSLASLASLADGSLSIALKLRLEFARVVTGPIEVAGAAHLVVVSGATMLRPDAQLFDAMLEVVANPPPSPCEKFSAAFVKWVSDHESFQIPGDLTLMFPDESNVENISRDLILLLDDNPNVQIGRFSGYPALSVAQIRLATGIEW